MSPKKANPPVAVNEQTLADLRAQMIAAGVTDEQALMDARRLALEMGTQTAVSHPADIGHLTNALRGKGVSGRILADRDLGVRE